MSWETPHRDKEQEKEKKKEKERGDGDSLMNGWYTNIYITHTHPHTVCVSPASSWDNQDYIDNCVEEEAEGQAEAEGHLRGKEPRVALSLSKIWSPLVGKIRWTHSLTYNQTAAG